MATKLYNKKNEPVWVKAKQVQVLLKNGYTTQPRKANQVKPEPVTFEEPVDFMQGTEDAEAEIRAKAKEAGIGNYWNKNLDALKEELGL